MSIGQSKLKLLSGNQKLKPAGRRLQHYNNPVFVKNLVKKFFSLSIMLNLPGSDQNVAHETSSQYGDHLCERVLKSDFKKWSYGPDTNLGHTDGRTTQRLYTPPNFFMGSIKTLNKLQYFSVLFVEYLGWHTTMLPMGKATCWVCFRLAYIPPCRRTTPRISLKHTTLQVGTHGNQGTLTDLW